MCANREEAVNAYMAIQKQVYAMPIEELQKLDQNEVRRPKHQINWLLLAGLVAGGISVSLVAKALFTC